ncbi:surface-adhesin E family protein [Paraherbaspirillum soli]|uniref:Surface-adhesin E family protein n=1 Tax=Paraherbaspirillum soli TaxID=631222 RepID=A0ABW0MD80_9BURK
MLILTLSAACATVQAADWQPFGGSDTAELKLDQDSIKEHNGLREVWSMWNFKEPRKNEGDASFPSFRSYQDLTEYNCRAKTMRLTKEILFAEVDGGGAKLDHSDALKNMKFSAPAKDSVAEKMMDIVCAFPLNAKAK